MNKVILWNHVQFLKEKKDTEDKVMDASHELLKTIVPIIIRIIRIIFVLVLLFVMLISVVYIMGCIYDSIFGNSFIRLGHFIAEKYPKIKEKSWAVKLWKKIQPKELYLRYETPLFAYCFSYTAISTLAAMLPNKNDGSIIEASVLYIVFYFLGMIRRCRSNEEYYNKVLENNIQFLKLSFLPLGFIITVLGFYFTITGMKVQELNLDFTSIINIGNQFMQYDKEVNEVILLLDTIVFVIFILILFYIVSLPVQVISYFVLLLINYFRKYKVGYIGLCKKCLSIIVYIFKTIM